METIDKFVKYEENSNGNQALIHLSIRLCQLSLYQLPKNSK